MPLTDVEVQTRRLAQEFARLPRNYLGAPPLQRLGFSTVDEFTTRALWALLAGAVLVLAVLSANVGGLVLANASARRREFGICTALGASRARLIREVTVEHVVVVIAGAAGGLWLASGLTGLLPTIIQRPTLNVIDVDYRALRGSLGARRGVSSS